MQRRTSPNSSAAKTQVSFDSPKTQPQTSPNTKLGPEPHLQTLYQSTYDSPIGRITIAAGSDALIGLWLDGQNYFAKTLQKQPIITQENLVLAQTKTWLDAYFRQANPDPHTIPLHPAGTDFQLAVWQILATIPYGQVMTYGEIARQIAQKLDKPKMSAQAIGGAVGRNPISIIIPCHRVVGAAGNLTGYAGGLDKKRFLLQLERIDLSQFR